MRPQSAKAKGRRLQQWVRDTLLKFAPNLDVTDILSTSMGAPGEDILISWRAQWDYPYSIECKNVEKLNIYNALEQAESNVRVCDKRPEGKTIPIVVFKRNKSKTYVALEFEEFLKLTRKESK